MKRTESIVYEFAGFISAEPQFASMESPVFAEMAKRFLAAKDVAPPDTEEGA